MPPGLGEILAESGDLTLRRLRKASDWRRLHGGTIDRALLATGAVSEETLLDALERVTGLPSVSRERLAAASREAIESLPADARRRLRALPFDRRGDVLYVAVVRPGQPGPRNGPRRLHGLRHPPPRHRGPDPRGRSPRLGVGGAEGRRAVGPERFSSEHDRARRAVARSGRLPPGAGRRARPLRPARAHSPRRRDRRRGAGRRDRPRREGGAPAHLLGRRRPDVAAAPPSDPRAALRLVSRAHPPHRAVRRGRARPREVRPSRPRRDDRRRDRDRVARPPACAPLPGGGDRDLPPRRGDGGRHLLPLLRRPSLNGLPGSEAVEERSREHP